MGTFDYVGPFVYSITIVTNNRIRAFTDPELTTNATDQLFRSHRKFGFRPIAYCFMPDHFHLLTQGERDDSDLIALIRHFKQGTGHAYLRNHPRRLWQPSFWDHYVRLEEDIEDVARYIWANPWRAGLVEDWTSYFGSGPRPFW